MDQTALTAHLPTVDVEITKRSFPERNAETITIHITATPSFDAAGQWLLEASMFPIAASFPLWAATLRAWQPWLSGHPGFGRLPWEAQ